MKLTIFSAICYLWISLFTYIIVYNASASIENSRYGLGPGCMENLKAIQLFIWDKIAAEHNELKKFKK